MWERINRFYPAWLELIPVLVLGFVLVYTVTHYGMLPEQIPTHFGFSGQADDWSPKGYGPVYLPVAIGGVIWLFLALLNYFLIIKPDDPGKCINMSQRQKEKLGNKQLELIRTTSARGLMLINLTMTVMIAVLQYSTVNTALGLQKGLGWSVNIFAIILFLEAIGLAIKTVGMSFTTSNRR